MVFIFHTIGGALTQTAATAINLLMIVLLLDALQSARKMQFSRHRCSMIRTYALGLSVSPARMFIIATDRLFHIPFEASFTAPSIIGVALHVLTADCLIRRQQPLSL